MQTKYFLLLIFGGLVAVSFANYLMTPMALDRARVPLAWATDSNPQRDPQVELFNKLYPDCELSIDPDNSGVMKVIVQSSAGMGPDLIGHISEANIQTYYDAGILWDVTDQAKERGFGLDTMNDVVGPLTQIKTLMPDGSYVDRQYTYPCNVFHTFIIYNKNLFDKYNVPYPPEDLTWEEYIKIAEKLTIYPKGDDKVPEIFGGAGVTLDMIIWEKGGRIMNSFGTRCALDSPEVVDATVFYHDLFYKYKVEPTPTEKAGVSSQGGWASGYRSWLGEGRLGMIWGARWMLIQFRRFITEQKRIREDWLEDHPGEDVSKAPPVLRLGACLVPRFKEGKRCTTFGARTVGINKQSKNREKALQFLQFLAGREYSMTINEGADSKPGNKKYISLELFRHPEFPEEEEVHAVAIKATPDGVSPNRSPFIPNSTVSRYLKDATSQLIASPSMTRKEITLLMKQTSDRINLDIARTIKRNKKMRRLYEKLLRDGAEPITADLQEVN